jgi:hypothetical protein
MKTQKPTESELMRRYSDLVTEALDPVQLNEGMMDTIRQYASKLARLLDPETLRQIADTVKQATGGNYSLTRANAQKVAQALGVSESQASMAEGISPTLGGKIAQALHLGAVGAVAASATGLIGTFGGLPIIIGLLALMFVDTFWGSAPGNIGSQYDQTGNQLGHAEIRPKAGVTPTTANPGFKSGMGSNIG